MAAADGADETGKGFVSQLVFDTFPSGIVVQDAAGRITAANPAAQTILGLSLDQMLGITSLDPGWRAVHQDGTPYPGETHPAMQALQSGQPVLEALMGVFNPRLGLHHWIEVNAIPLRDPSGQHITGVYSTFQNISARLEREAQTRQSLAIIQSSEDAIVANTLDGVVTSWNPKAESMFGYTASEMIGRSLAILRPADRQQEEENILQEIRQGHVVEHFETVRVRKDGSLIDVDISISPVRGALGNIIGASKITRDISRQKQAERALRDKNAEFRIAVQTSSDGFWIADAQGRLLEVNDAYVRLSGYSREELLGMSIPDLDFSDDQIDVARRMQRIVRNGAERFVTAHRSKGDRRWPVEVVASYAPLEGGRFFCFIKDLTEQQNNAELIWHQANFDRLTDLPNRALFFDRLSQECSAARRNGKSVALLFADLDAFKAVNDRWGHDAGDTVLRTVATRWLSCVRATDTVARLGGDEFAIIVGNLDGPTEAATVAQKLIDAVQKPIALEDDVSCAVGASVGIALYPHNAVEMDSLLVAADKAMYLCKKRGKNAFAFTEDVASASESVMNWVNFNDAHLVGVAEIDAQHRELVRMVNELNREISASAGVELIESRFDQLIAYTVFHFQTEHRFMVNAHYPDAKAHDFEHGQLTTELRLIARKKSNEGDLLVLQKIKDWLLNHIQSTDKPMGRYLNEKGVY